MIALAGNDAHGNFNRFRQIGIPFLTIRESEHQLFGKMRTGVFLESLSEKNFLNAIHSGMVILTDGPIANLSVINSDHYISSIGCTFFGKEQTVLLELFSSTEFGTIDSYKLFKGCIGQKESILVSENHEKFYLIENMSYDQNHPFADLKNIKLSMTSVLRWLLHLGLFLLTFFTTTIAGVLWLNQDPFELSNFHLGIPYSVSILFILACHEFGHYFASRYHKVDATLPYFLPFPPIPVLLQLFLNFGTFGAVIRTKTVVPSKKVMFDIGVAGPIAGFFASLLVLAYGFLHLPSSDFILAIHTDYDFAINASASALGIPLAFGNTFLFSGLKELLTNPSMQFVPPMSEIYHYPFLCAGWFGLFVTALNLIPMGQFDGGHLIYTMFGNLHRKIALISFYALFILSIPSLSDTILRTLFGFVYNRDIGQVVPFAQYSWTAWFLWAMIARYVVKLYHPPVTDETPLDTRRIAIGWFCILIFILSFSINPFTIT
jgi:membrane-associated protease RseP (regulator of RpoE activity)